MADAEIILPWIGIIQSSFNHLEGPAESITGGQHAQLVALCPHSMMQVDTNTKRGTGTTIEEDFPHSSV
ncbi:hypothetical protein C8F04DRAFT_1268899 [Mycena alexandri]|uniref:Uncharacterized protein n=1 Tax=Mycena alexandri TaxID=1745969 RepID=A0AAD6SFE9_9AGAR|nr:hypothetical protein C8F04DRAFT_1268899 [Mycena alexandri]